MSGNKVKRYFMTKHLTEVKLHRNPTQQFAMWLKEAMRCRAIEYPEAMCLATIDSNGFPESRMVLLKKFDERGFTFHTNVESKKGKSLLRIKKAALTFYWEPLHRQVRIQGRAELVSDDEADCYFQTRSRPSQIGAWASKQSRVLKNRELLELRITQFKKKFIGRQIPRPPHWVGFRVVPMSIEFWQQRAHRLHDRFLFVKKGKHDWQVVRLYP